MQAINIATECLARGKEWCYSFTWGGEKGESADVKLTQTDRADLIGGTVFLLLLATALFLSAFL